MVLKVLKGAAAAAALWSCQALSARSIIQSWVLVNAFCQPEELRGSDGASVVLTDLVACYTVYAQRAGGALQHLTLRPTCDFRLTGSLLRLVIMCVSMCVWWVGGRLCNNWRWWMEEGHVIQDGRHFWNNDKHSQRSCYLLNLEMTGNLPSFRI